MRQQGQVSSSVFNSIDNSLACYCWGMLKATITLNYCESSARRLTLDSELLLFKYLHFTTIYKPHLPTSTIIFPAITTTHPQLPENSRATRSHKPGYLEGTCNKHKECPAIFLVQTPVGQARSLHLRLLLLLSASIRLCLS